MKHAEPAIVLEHVVRQFDRVCAVDTASLRVAAGEMIAILGPSGCGKTTLLRLIAGLDRPDAGAIWIGGRQVAGAGIWVPPEQRGVGLVFQDGALFPHLTVGENITFALGQLRTGARAQRAAELLELVGLRDLATRYPHQLSGGQQQRVALARALAPQPAVVLLDEPFASLDAALRVELREEIVTILRALRTTVLLVTHDQEEALSLADRVVLLLAGNVAQVGTPTQIYTRPSSRAVAAFVGDANWIRADACEYQATCCLGAVALSDPICGLVDLLVRPEQLALECDPAAKWEVQRVRYFGHDQLVTIVATPELRLQVRLTARARFAPGTRVAVRVREPLRAFPTADPRQHLMPRP